MAFITYPLNNINYTAEDAELFHCTRTSGIWAENSFPISVTGADNNVTIGTGIAWINNEEFSGKVAALKSAEVLDLGIADSTYPRIDVIAIQFNANSNETDVVVKRGTPATNPIKPAIVRTGAVYELYLASVYRPAGATIITMSNITDLRMDETVCGLMADSVTKVDMTAIEAQVRSLINNLQKEIDSVRNLSGIMFESEWVEDDVIPVIKGGTGATSIKQARTNLGCIGINEDFSSEEELLAQPSGFTNYVNWNTDFIDGVKSKVLGVMTVPAGYSKYQLMFQGATMTPEVLLRTIDIEADNMASEWEWVNPPMKDKVEYRTIERFNGCPVYKMCRTLSYDSEIMNDWHCFVGSDIYTEDTKIRILDVTGYGDTHSIKDDEFVIETINNGVGITHESYRGKVVIEVKYIKLP